jgi:hypothetical protein
MNITGKHEDQVSFGLGPATIVVGDEVVILWGCSVPFILRRQQELGQGFVYELVGEAFAYGFMDGEAIMEWRKHGDHLYRFSIA